MKKNNRTMIGFGTAAIGRPLYININQGSDKKAFSHDDFHAKGISALESAYQQGIRYFDTAPGYGMAEQLLLDWVSEKGDSDIEIATKWGYTYVANFDPTAKQHEVKEHSLDKLNEQWDKSKALLPHLTTYQIHSATLETGVLENEKVLNRLAELKVKHQLLIGITTTGANQKDILQKALEIHGNGIELFDTLQMTYNIFDQSIASIAAELAKRNKRLIIKEALANGRIFANPKYTHYRTAYGFLAQLATKYNVGVDAIALRFCIDSIPVFNVLSGAANESHLVDNLQVDNFMLSEDELDTLRSFAVDPIDYWSERKSLEWN